MNRFKINPFISPLLVFIGLIFLSATPAWAQERRWDAGGGDNDYDTANNWTSNNTPDGVGEDAVLDDTFTVAAGDWPVEYSIGGNNATISIRHYIQNTPGRTALLMRTNDNLTVTGEFTLTSGIFQMSDVDADLNIDGAAAIYRNNGGTFLGSTGEVHIKNGATIMTSESGFYDLTFDAGNGNLSNGTTVVVANRTTISATLNANGATLRTALWSRTGTFNAGTSTVEITGTTNLGGETFYRLVIKTGASVTLTSAITVQDKLTIETGATLNAGANTITIGNTGTPTTNGGDLQVDGTGQLSSSGTVQFYGDGATHDFSGTGSITFGTLLLGDGNAGGSNTNFSSVTLSTTTFNLVSGTTTAEVVNAGSSSITINAGGTMTLNNAGTTWNYDTGTVVWKPSASLPTVAGSSTMTFYNLKIETTGTVTIASTTLDVQNNLTLQTGTLGDGSTRTLQVGATWINNGGSFNETGTLVQLTGRGSGGRTILLGGGSSTTAETFNNLVVLSTTGTATGTIANGMTITVSGTLTLGGANAGLLEGGSNSFLVTSTMVMAHASSNFDEGTCEVTWKGRSGQTIPPETFYRLIIDRDNGAAVLGGSITVKHILQINSGAPSPDLQAGSYTITLNSAGITAADPGMVINGSFTAGTGTVAFSGTNSVTDSIRGSAASKTFNNITVSKTTDASGLEIQSAVTVNGSFLVQSGTLKLNISQTLTANGGMTIGDGSPTDGTIEATFQLSGSSQLTMGGNSTLLVDYTGKIISSGSAPPIQTASGTYTFAVYGSIEFSAATVRNTTASGLHVILNPNVSGGNGGPNSNLVKLDNVEFADVNTQALWVEVANDGSGNTNAYSKTFTGMSFNYASATSTLTVKFSLAGGVSTTTARTITVLNSTGASGGSTEGERKDDDSDNASAPPTNNPADNDDSPNYALVKWVDPVYWQYDGVSTDWNWSSGGQTNWRIDSGGTATYTSIPDSTKAIIIQNSPPSPFTAQAPANFPRIPASYSAQCKTLDLKSYTLEMVGTSTLTIGGKWATVGTVTFTPGSGKVIFNGSGDVVPADITFYDLNITGAAALGIETTGTITMSRDLTIDDGTTLKSAHFLNVGRYWVTNGTGNLSPQSGCRVTFNGSAAQEIKAYTDDTQSELAGSKIFSFRDIVFSNSNQTSINTSGISTLDVNGTLTISGTTTLVGGNHTIKVKGTWTLNSAGSSFSPGTGTVIMDNTGTSQIIGSDQSAKTFSFYNLTIENTTSAGVSIAVGTATGATLNIDNNIQIGTASNPGAKLDATNDSILVAKDWKKNSGATFVNTGSTVTLDGNGAQSVDPTTFNILKINKSSSTATAVGNISAAQVVVEEGSFDFGSGFTHTITYTGSAARAIEVQAGGTLNLTGSTLNITSDGNASGEESLYVAGTATVTFGSAAVLTIEVSGTGTYPSVLANGTINASGATPPEIRDPTPSSTPHYSFQMVNTTKINISEITFKDFDVNGIVIQNPASVDNGTVNEISKMNFAAKDSANPSTYNNSLVTKLTTVNLPLTFRHFTFNTAGNGATSSVPDNIDGSLLDASDSITMQMGDPALGQPSPGTYGNASDENDPNGRITWIVTARWTGGDNVQGDWNDTDNWNTSAVPDSSTNVIIPSIAEADPPFDLNLLNTNTANCRDITLQSGSEVSLAAGADRLDVYGNLVIQNGGYLKLGYNTSEAANQDNSNIQLRGNWDDQTVYDAAGKGFKHLVATATTADYVQAIGTTTSYIKGNTTFGNLRIGSGGENAIYYLYTGGTYTIDSSGFFTVNSSATFRGGDTTASGTPATMHFKAGSIWYHYSSIAWDPDESTVIWETANSIPENDGAGGATNTSVFYNLEIAGTTTLARALVVRNNLIIRSGAVLNAAGYNVTVGGDLTINGTFNDGGGSQTVIFDAYSQPVQDITPGNTVFRHVSGNATQTLNLAGAMTIAGSFTLSSNTTLDLNTYTLEARGDVVENSSALVYDTGTFYLNGTTQSVPFTTFYNLQLGTAVTYRLKGSTTVLNDFTMASATLDFDSNSVDDGAAGFQDDVVYSMTFNGHFTVSSGAFQMRSGSASLATFNITGNKNITNNSTGDLTFNNFTKSGAANVAYSADAITKNLIFTGTLTVSAGTFDVGSGFTGTDAHAVSSTTGVNVTGGTLELSSSTMTVTSASAGVSVSGGVLKMTNNAAILDVDGYFSCTAGGTLDCTGSTAEIRVAGAWTMSGSYSVGSSTVIFNVAGLGANSSITITAAAPTDFYRLIIDKNSTTKAVIAASTTQTVDIGAGNLIIRRGAFETSTKTVTVAGNVAQDTASATGTLTVGDTTPSSGGQLTVTGDVTVTAGTLNVSFPNSPGDGLLILNGATFAPSGLTAGNGTIRFTNSAADRSVPSFTYNNVHIANGTTYKYTPAGTLTVGGTLQIGVSGVASGKFELAGATTHTAGALRFENGGILNLSSRELEVSGTVTAAAGAAATVNFNTGTLDANGSTFNATDISLQFGGSTGELQLASTSITFGSVSAANGTMAFDGSYQTVPTTISYYNVRTAGTGIVTNASGTLTVSNNLTVASGTFSAATAMDINGNVTVTGTLTAGSSTHTVAGNWTDASGTFTTTLGKVTFDGSSQAIDTKSDATNGFNQLQIGNDAGNSNTIVTTSTGDALRVNGQLTVKNTCRLNLRSGDHAVASAGKVVVDAGGVLDIQDSGSPVTFTANRTAEVSPTADFDVSGTLYLRDRAVIKLPNDAKLGIAGTLDAVGTTTSLKPVIQSTNPGTTFFYFLMENATITVDALGINSVRNNGTGQFAQGVEIKGANTSITQFNRVLFQNAQNPVGADGGVHLKLTATGDWTTTTSLTFSGLAFDTTYDDANVAGDAPPQAIVWGATSTISVTVTISNPYQSDEVTPFTLATGEADDRDDVDRGAGSVAINWEEAYIWDGSQSTDWYDIRNWSTEGLGQFPGGTNPRRDVILRNVGSAPALGTTTAAHAKNLTIESSVNFSFSGAGTFSVSGNISMIGTSTLTPATGLFVMDGSGAQSISLSATGTFSNLTVANSAAAGTKVSAAGSFTVSGTMTVARGTFATNSGVTVTVNGLTTIDDASNYTVDGTLDITNGTFRSLGGINNTSTASGTNEGTITFGAAGTGTLRIDSTGTWTHAGAFSQGNGTVIYSGATKNITPAAYYNLITENDGSARTYSLTGTTTVANNLTIENSTTLDSQNNTFQIGGHWNRQTSSGAFTEGSGTVVFNGTGGQQIQVAETFYNLTVDTGGSVTCLGTVTVSNQLRVTDGTMDLGTSLAHSVNGTGTAALLISPDPGAGGATLNLNTSRLTVAGGIQIDQETATTNEGTLDMTGTSTLSGAELDVAGSFLLNGGILDLSNNGPEIEVAGSWTATAGSSVTLTNSTGTIRMDATSGSPTITTLNSGDFQNLDMAVGGGVTVTLESSVDIRGNIVFTSGTLAKGVPSAVTLTVYGNWDDVGGSDNFNQAGTVVTFAGSGASSVDPDTFNHMTVAKSSATATALGTITVGGTLTVSTGNLALSSYTGHSFGTVQLSGGTLALNTSTSSASGNVTVASGAILDMDQGSMAVTGTLSVTGSVDMSQNSAATYDLDVTSDITIVASGTLTATAANVGIRTAGNWSDGGGAISWSTSAGVTMSGSGKTITVPDGITTNDFNHLIISGTATATQGMDINGNLTVEVGGTLDLDNGSQKTHDVAGNILVKADGTGFGTLNFQGAILRMSQAPGSVTETVTFQSSGSNRAKWVMDDNSQFLLENNNKVVCNGEFICDGVYSGDTAGSATGAAKPKITGIVENGTDRHEIWLQGKIDVRNLLHKYKNSNGLTIGGSVSLTSDVTTFDNIDFRNAASGGRHVRIGGSVTGSKTSNGCSFDSTYTQGSGYNVESMSSTASVLSFDNIVAFGGEGEDYDLEWDGGNHIVWIIQTIWTGASNTDGDWNRSSNWSNGVPGQDSTAIVEDVQAGASIFDAVISSSATYTVFSLIVKKHGAAADANGGDLTLSGGLVVRGDLSIEGTSTVSTEWGRVAMGNAASRLEARAKWTDDKGGLSQSNGIVVFSGSTQQEVVGTATFQSLRLSNDALLRTTGTATMDNRMSVIGTTTGLTIDSGKTFTMQSQNNTYRPILALGGTATVVGTGTFVAKRDTTTNAKPRVTNTTGSASDRFGFTLNGGVDITALDFNYGNSNGLSINTGATLINLSGIDFSYGSTTSTSRHLRIARAAEGRIDCPDVTFDLVGTNTANASGTPYNVTVTSTATFVAVFAGTVTLGGPGAGEDYDEDLVLGTATWTQGLNVISSYAGTETSGETGGLVGYFFPGASASYGLIRRGSPSNPLDDELKAVNPSTGATLATFAVSHTSYGPVVGRPLVSGDDIFFGTKGGYLFNVRYGAGTFTTVQAVRPKNGPGGSEITAIEITSPIISDLPFNSYNLAISNLYFGCLGTATQPYFFGVTISDFTQRPASTSFPIELFAGGTVTYPCRSEPSIDRLTISGTTTNYVFIGTDEDAGSPSYSHLMRVNVSTGVPSDVVEYTTAGSRPDSNVGAPIQEWAGVLTTGTITTNGTSTVYLLRTDVAGTMTSYANWPLTGSTGAGGAGPHYGGGIEGGIDTDNSTNVAFGTTTGGFYNRNFSSGSNKFSPAVLDGAVRMYPVYNFDGGQDVYYVGTDNGKLYRINANTGAYTVKLDLGVGQRIRGVSFNGSNILISTSEGVLYVMAAGP